MFGQSVAMDSPTCLDALYSLVFNDIQEREFFDLIIEYKNRHLFANTFEDGWKLNWFNSDKYITIDKHIYIVIVSSASVCLGFSHLLIYMFSTKYGHRLLPRPR